jgi:hypothetical protein
MADETARVTVSRIVRLDDADQFIGGWQQMIMIELAQMRAKMPFADTLVLTLATEREAAELWTPRARSAAPTRRPTP